MVTCLLLDMPSEYVHVGIITCTDLHYKEEHCLLSAHYELEFCPQGM